MECISQKLALTHKIRLDLNEEVYSRGRYGWQMSVMDRSGI